MASVDEYAHDKEPMVIDHGSFEIQAGFAEEDCPRTVFQSIVGRPRHQEVLDDLTTKLNFRDSYVGEEAQNRRGVLTLTYPIERGIIAKWDDMEAVWSHTFSEIKFNPQDEGAVLSQIPNNPKPNKEKMAEIFFEKFQSPGICLANQAALALFSLGKTCGLIVDSGHGVTHVVPIHPENPLPPTTLQMDLAGGDLDEALFSHLVDEHKYNGRLTDLRVVKEKLCYVALDPDNESQARTPPMYSSDQNTYELPSGETITVDPAERYGIPEALFNPSIIKKDFFGIHEMAYNSISGLQTDVREDLLRLVYLVGGSTLFPGFKERMKRELTALAPPSMKVSIVATPDRKYSVWIGGSIFASRNPDYIETHWIKKQEYEEIGPDVVHRKYL
ncbi:actin-15B [Strongylocentrotus purpuratus]|uniref:Actin n=1 Tax=Strongylocentrotus purpuratus TaxID=7668 RepID=A0A7M7HQX2_STRPU|nr:actin-15B [Strongylocentrotus purpuratus]